MSYLISVLTAAEVYTLLVLSANLQWGTLGMVTLSTAGFAGIGAYGAIYAARFFGPSSLLPFCISMILPAVISLLVFRLVIKFKGIYLIAVSLAIQYCLENAFASWMGVTRGALGITGVRASLLGQAYSGDLAVLAIASVVVISALVLSNTVFYRGHYGLVLRSIREDEIAARSLGITPRTLQSITFVASSVMAGLGGALLAAHLDFVNPSVFSLGESLALLAGVIVGGRGSMVGSILGAVVLVVLPEMLRFLPLPTATFADLRQALFGLMLVLFLITRPKGLVPETNFLRQFYARS
jgi:ABC-type branched-subunit amino acid transport system permease subunit